MECPNLKTRFIAIVFASVFGSVHAQTHGPLPRCAVAEMIVTGTFPQEPDYSSAYQQMRDDINATFKPKFKAIPFQSWRNSAESISQEKNPFRALDKFSNLRWEKVGISEAIRQASFELDGGFRARSIGVAENETSPVSLVIE